MAKKYRPSNGIEGDGFCGQWCDHCKRDTAAEYGCSIRAAAEAFAASHAEYPTEWIYDEDGKPCCTAFEEARDAADES